MTQQNGAVSNLYDTNCSGAPSVVWNPHFILVHLELCCWMIDNVLLIIIFWDDKFPITFWTHLVHPLRLVRLELWLYPPRVVPSRRAFPIQDHTWRFGPSRGSPDRSAGRRAGQSSAGSRGSEQRAIVRQCSDRRRVPESDVRAVAPAVKRIAPRSSARSAHGVESFAGRAMWTVRLLFLFGFVLVVFHLETGRGRRRRISTNFAHGLFCFVFWVFSGVECVLFCVLLLRGETAAPWNPGRWRAAQE